MVRLVPQAYRWPLAVLALFCFASVTGTAGAADPAFRKAVRYRSNDKEEAAELRWDEAKRILSLHDSAGKAIPWPESVTLADIVPRPPAPTAVEPLDETVAVLGFRERLTGRIRGVRNRREVAWSIGDSAEPTRFDSSAAYAWAFNPGKSTLLYRSFGESAETAADGRGLLRLGGSRREALVPSSAAPRGSALFQLAFEEAAAAADNGPLTLAIFSPSGQDPVMSVRLETKDDNWELTSPAIENATPARIPRKPGLHHLGVLYGGGRVLFCVDESVAHSVRAPADTGAFSAVSITADADRPRAIASIAAFAFGRTAKTLMWPIEDDAFRLSGGHEWLGSVRSLASGTWKIAEGENVRELPLGLTETWVPPARQSQFVWASGTVVELTFFGPPASIWNMAANDTDFVSLGLLTPPEKGQDRVEGAVEQFDAAGITLRLSQGGSVRVSFDRIVAIRGSDARGLRLVDARPYHLGNDIDLRVIPPLPYGDRLELVFEASAEEAGAAVELAVDVLEAVGVETPRFGELIAKGELVTELRINDKPLGLINDKVSSSNDKPERIRFTVPAGTLKTGPNRVEFRQKGRSNDPNYLDNLSILGVRLYRKS